MNRDRDRGARQPSAFGLLCSRSDRFLTARGTSPSHADHIASGRVRRQHSNTAFFHGLQAYFPPEFRIHHVSGNDVRVRDRVFRKKPKPLATMASTQSSRSLRRVAIDAAGIELGIHHVVELAIGSHARYARPRDPISRWWTYFDLSARTGCHVSSAPDSSRRLQRSSINAAGRS